VLVFAAPRARDRKGVRPSLSWMERLATNQEVGSSNLSGTPVTEGPFRPSSR
jgi:hypothetical protein